MKSKQQMQRLIKFSPIAASILLSFPMVSQADISLKNGAIDTVGGVPVVNINQANANGISHNIYDKLNVGKEGLVFNNSQNGANTLLAGQVDGNKNLASGSAKVILNEVQSKNRSELNGFMEVAGSKAQLIVANPSGITCNSCGFINTDKVTLTTGTPDMQNGELKGYTVNGGDIKVENQLLNDSPTAILARSAVINGDVRVSGQQLAVVVGNNYVDTNNQVTGSAKATGTKSSYSLDVSKLGGMYADKISLVSTESGVGVRNSGVLAAGNGGIQIDSKGRLINTNAQIKSAGVIGMKLAGDIDNVTGKIVSDKAIYLDTGKNAINNSRAGNIMSSEDIAISSGAFNNTNGKVAASGVLSVNTNGNTLTNSGQGKAVGMEAGVVVLDTGLLNNRDGQIKGYYVGIKSTSVNNNNATIDAYQNIDISSNGNVDNTGGRIRSATGKVKIDAAKGTLWNNQTKSADTASDDSLGIIAGDGGIEISSGRLENNGQIVSSGNIGILSSALVKNNSGKIQSLKTISIQSNGLDNGTGAIVAKGDINVDSTKGALENHIGAFSSEEGSLNLKGQRIYNYGGMMLGKNINIDSAGEVNNNVALMVATDNITINTLGNVTNNDTNNFGKNFGLYFGMANQQGGIIGKDSVDITANNIYNNNSRIIAETGALSLAAARTLSNERSMLVSRTNMDLRADSMSNNYSTIHATGNLDINTRTLSNYSSGNIIDNNATGIISADKDLTLNVGSNFTNYGYISGGDKVSLTSTGTIYNRNTIFSENEVDVYGKTGVTNSNDLIANKKLTVTSTGTIENSGNMFTEGVASFTGKKIQSTSNTGVMGGRQGLLMKADSITYKGKIIGLDVVH